MKRFTEYIDEFLVNNHTGTPTSMSDGDEIIDLMISLAGPKVEIINFRNKMFINTKQVRKTDGTPTRWVYIWKYFWDNPGSTKDQCADALLDTVLKGNIYLIEDIIDIVTNNVHPTMTCDTYGNYTATHPKCWKAN